MLFVVVGLAVYWSLLHRSHDTMREQVRADTQRLAGQTAEALSLQMDTVVRQLDYFTQYLGWLWEQGDIATFNDSASVAVRTLPTDALAQVAIADAQGDILYSNLSYTGVKSSQPPVSIADREHFKVHAEANAPFLFISDPIKGRISQQWTIQFTRGLWKDGEFRGVIVLAVSAEYLATALKAIFPDQADAASLVKSDGTYLARSYHLSDVLGKSLPSSRPFIQRPEQDMGSYEAVAEIDQTQRFYSWRRVDGQPLVILVGADAQKAMSLTEEAIENSRWQSGAGSSLLLLACLSLAWLWTQRSMRSAQLQSVADALRASEARFRVTLDVVKDGLWKYDHLAGTVQWDARILNMLGYGDDYHNPSMDALSALIHPADLVRLQGMPVPDPGSAAVMNVEFRLRKADGRWLWVRARGGVIESTPDGSPLFSVGTLSDISEQVAEDQLRDALLNRSAAAILLVSPDRRIVDANEQFSSIFLKPGQNLNALDLHDLHVNADDCQQLASAYTAVKANGHYRGEYPFKDAEGHIRWFDIHAVLQNPEDPESNVIWTWIDITSRHRADAALAIETTRLNTVLKCYPGGVLIQDADNCVVFANTSWPKLLGVDIPESALVGIHDSELRERVGPQVSAWLRARPPCEGKELRRSHEVTTDQDRHLEIDHIEIRLDEQYFGSLFLVRDITSRKKHELELAQLASTDALTALPNRRSFMQSLDALHSRAVELGKEAGVVMMLDIDRFKRVNDTYGHAVGDIVLQRVSQAIRAAIRSADIPGRVGGEEFAVLQPNISLSDGLIVAERIRRQVENTCIDVDGTEIRVTISIGVSSVCEAYSAEMALQQADTALYTAKSSGRNRVCLWEPGQEQGGAVNQQPVESAAGQPQR